MKLLIYAQDTQGLGHVRRCLTIAQAVLDLRPDAAVLLATKSAWPAAFDLGPRFDFLKLPAQLTAAAEGADRAAETAAIRALRRALLREAVVHLQPNLVLIDNEPIGAQGEMLDAIDALPPNARLVFGMRDVVDDPDAVQARWHEDGVHSILEDRFARILVYGDSSLFDSLEIYQMPASVRKKSAYTGYICSPPHDVDEGRFRRDHSLGDAPLVVASGGGGHDAVDMLVLTAQAVEILDPKPRLVLVTGPLMSPTDVERTTAAGRNVGATVLREVNLLDAMAAADALVTMGGYNTMVEALMMQRRPIVVPRATRKREQLLRANAFTQADLAQMVPLMAGAEALAAAVAAEFSQPAQPDGRRHLDPNAENTARLLVEVLDQ